MTTMAYTGTLVVEECPKCGIIHAIPEGLYTEARRHGTSVYCPLGHSWHFTKSIEAELQEARNDVAYYRNTLKTKEVQLQHTERSRAAYKGELTKTRQRAQHGQCPVCRVKFKRLASHVAAKHPDFVAEIDLG
jgi:hypothetical protein